MMSLALLCAVTDAGAAQQPASTPEFEAASVKASSTGTRGWSISYSTDWLRASNATLAALIQSAYGIRDDRLDGGPGWVRTARFDVNAKAGQALPREQLRLMAQHLLENRFGLVLTREQRQQEAYLLRVARADGRLGPDVRRADDNCLDQIAGIGSSPSQLTRSGLTSSTGANPTFSGRCAKIASLAEGLSRSLGVDVVDQTGLQGRWDFVIAYSALAPNASPGGEPTQTTLPTAFTAVEEQLGLRLERNARGSVEYLVIAAAHPPTDN